MGDRASLAVIAAYHGKRFALHMGTAWRGEELPERVRAALHRSRPRHGDALYMNRIMWDAVCVDDWGSLDGYWMGPLPWDTEHGRPMLVVDVDRQTVGTAPIDRRSNMPQVERAITWTEYVARQPRAWGRDLLAKP